jgi:acyl-CoA synthetase (AMP-forming)/AMP-acid ligase II
MCSAVPLLRCGTGHHELPDAWLHTGHDRTLRPVARTGFHTQGTLYGSLRCTDHVHCRTASPHVPHVRLIEPAHGYHGRISLSCGTDETGGRKNVYARHQCIRTDRGFTGYDPQRIDDDPEVRYTTVGHDFEFTEVKVIDPTTGEECPVGVQGEMCNRGYNTMKGYYKNPEATAEVIDANGFLHSGDLGVKDENGNYRITGRIKDMIIRGGENIYPREIEEFLYKMPGIKDVQVAGVPSKKYGEAVGAFIILHEGYTMNEFDVREFCQGKIARYKIPKYIFFVKEFPMTGSGKIQKFKLKDLSLKLCAEQGIEII